MNKFSLLKRLGLALALVCAVLTLASNTASAAHIRANAGTTFTPFVPLEFDAQGNPTKLSHIVDGVVQVSSLGNCTVHFDVVGVPRPDGNFALAGTVRITSADGQTTLNANVEGATSAEPANALMANFYYAVAFTGGTGPMANARGRARIDGLALFNEGFAGGKATWTMKGYVLCNKKEKP